MKKPGSDKKLIIAVIGGGQCSPKEAVLAEAVGRELAKREAILVCGGLGGVMEAACRGATIESGLTVGILPSDDPTTGNPYVQIPVATGVGYARNIAVVKSAQAVIAVDGDYGALSEIAYALKNGIPVIRCTKQAEPDQTRQTIYTSLAYGVQGFHFWPPWMFGYQKDADGKPVLKDGRIVPSCGVPWLAEIAAEVRTMSPVLVRLRPVDAEEVKETGSAVALGTAFRHQWGIVFIPVDEGFGGRVCMPGCCPNRFKRDLGVFVVGSVGPDSTQHDD